MKFGFDADMLRADTKSLKKFWFGKTTQEKLSLFYRRKENFC